MRSRQKYGIPLPELSDAEVRKLASNMVERSPCAGNSKARSGVAREHRRR